MKFYVEDLPDEIDLGRIKVEVEKRAPPEWYYRVVVIRIRREDQAIELEVPWGATLRGIIADLKSLGPRSISDLYLLAKDKGTQLAPLDSYALKLKRVLVITDPIIDGVATVIVWGSQTTTVIYAPPFVKIPALVRVLEFVLDHLKKARRGGGNE